MRKIMAVLTLYAALTVPAFAQEPSSSKHEAAKNTMTTVAGAAGALVGSAVGGMIGGPPGAIVGGAVGGAVGAIGAIEGNRRLQDAIDARHSGGGGGGSCPSFETMETGRMLLSPSIGC